MYLAFSLKPSPDLHTPCLSDWCWSCWVSAVLFRYRLLSRLSSGLNDRLNARGICFLCIRRAELRINSRRLFFASSHVRLHFLTFGNQLLLALLGLLGPVR